MPSLMDTGQDYIQTDGALAGKDVASEYRFLLHKDVASEYRFLLHKDAASDYGYTSKEWLEKKGEPPETRVAICGVITRIGPHDTTEILCVLGQEKEKGLKKNEKNGGLKKSKGLKLPGGEPLPGERMIPETILRECRQELRWKVSKVGKRIGGYKYTSTGGFPRLKEFFIVEVEENLDWDVPVCECEGDEREWEKFVWAGKAEIERMAKAGAETDDSQIQVLATEMLPGDLQDLDTQWGQLKFVKELCRDAVVEVLKGLDADVERQT